MCLLPSIWSSKGLNNAICTRTHLPSSLLDQSERDEILWWPWPFPTAWQLPACIEVRLPSTRGRPHRSRCRLAPWLALSCYRQSMSSGGVGSRAPWSGLMAGSGRYRNASRRSCGAPIMQDCKHLTCQSLYFEVEAQKSLIFDNPWKVSELTHPEGSLHAWLCFQVNWLGSWHCGTCCKLSSMLEEGFAPAWPPEKHRRACSQLSIASCLLRVSAESVRAGDKRDSILSSSKDVLHILKHLTSS